jgi:ribose 5-phosphate isomerase B
MTKIMSIAFGADHAGYEMKQALIEYAEQLGWKTLDFGTDSTEPHDYPLVVPPVVEALRKEVANFGVLVCGSGIGVDIVANRHRGMRSALCHTAEMAATTRTHNDANILSLGSNFVTLDVAKEALKNFVETKFEPVERHVRRINMIDQFM